MSIFRMPRRNHSISQSPEAVVEPVVRNEAATAESHLEEALRRWMLVAEGNPNDLESRLEMVNVLKKLSNNEALDAVIEDLDKRFSQVRRAQLVVARHYMNIDHNQLAIQRWLAIEEKYHDQYESTNSLAYLYLREGQYEQVLVLADVLAEKQGVQDKALKLRARAHQCTENWSEAIACWQQLLELNHDDEAELQLITAHLKRNDLSSASALVEQALARSPDNPALVSLKVSVLVRQEQWQDALKLTDVLSKLRPDNSDVLYKRASVLYQLGMHDESDAMCEQLLRKSPDDIRVLTLFARIGQARIAQSNATRTAVV